jgi:hypothetical protein
MLCIFDHREIVENAFARLNPMDKGAAENRAPAEIRFTGSQRQRRLRERDWIRLL